MTNLHITNSHFISYKDDLLTIDILGGVNLQQIERMIVTLRVSYANYSPFRTTLDLYNDAQVEKLVRTLCDKWELKLADVSRSLHAMILQLEEYRLQEMKYKGKQRVQPFEISEEERKKAISFLKQKNLPELLIAKLNDTGILGEDNNALILFLAMASHSYVNPFSVICLAKNGIGKSYILQKLSQCMPDGACSFHSRISANALYYFDSSSIQDKALIIEDLEWTTQMLQPLATLQAQGRLVNTRATKDKDGMLHSTSFEVVARLCLLACAYSDKSMEEISLPFLCVQLNHSHAQDLTIMAYQKQCKAGQVRYNTVKESQQFLKGVIASLRNISVINPFATLIDLPSGVAYPRKSLLLLLNFIETITYCFQYQREQCVDKDTGELFIKTHPKDIELAFELLKNNLFRNVDDLSANARGFYQWLAQYLAQAKTQQFTALDIRRAKAIHPRTLNRYLQELKLFSYIQVTGGNRHREGFIYKLTGLGNQPDVQSRNEQDIQATLKQVWKAYYKEQQQETNEEPKQEVRTEKNPGFFDHNYKRIRINEKEEYTLKLILELEAQNPNRKYIASDFTAITGRSQTTEARQLKTLWEQGKLNREWKDRQYFYSLNTNSKTISQNPMSNPKNQDQ